MTEQLIIPVLLRAVGGVDGDWVVTRVNHTFSDSGYSTRVEAETPKT